MLDHETAPSYTVMVSAAGTGTGANPPAQRFVLTIANARDGIIGGWASVPVQGTVLSAPAVSDPDDRVTT